MIISQPSVSCAELFGRFPEFFVDVNRDVIGDGARTFTGVGAPEIGGANLALFLATPKSVKTGLTKPAAVYVVDQKHRATAEAARSTAHTIVIAQQVDHAMSVVMNSYFLKTPYTNAGVAGVHPTAVVSSSARLAPGTRIGPHAVIGAGVQIASDVYIGANAVIEDDVTIGAGAVIHPLVFIGHSTVIGARCEIHPNSVIGKEGFGYAHDKQNNHYRIPHVGRVVLEDDVHIGSCVTIDRSTFHETRLEKGAKLDNHIHIGHNSSIGRNGLVTAGCLLAGSTKIGANFLSGGNTVVAGHIEICDNVQVSAVSGIGKTITKPGQYGGLPLLPLRRHLKMKAALVQLAAMRAQLAKISKHLGLAHDDAPDDSL